MMTTKSLFSILLMVLMTVSVTSATTFGNFNSKYVTTDSLFGVRGGALFGGNKNDKKE